MITDDFERLLLSGGIGFVKCENLSAHTTVGIGGSADYFFQPTSVIELLKTAEIAQKCGKRTFFLGGGSNVLISDSGFRGAVISTRKLNEIYIESDCGGEVYVRAFCGARLYDLTSFCADNGLTGLEFLSGIPGTVGGAVNMNAGCFGKSVQDVIVSVQANTGGSFGTVFTSDCGFSYRNSIFQSTGGIILSALFRTKTAARGEILSKTEAFKTLRTVQPKGKSLGSVFKNGQVAAGKAIESAGLKGLRVGGAFVSEKHANFIINDGTATAADFYDLIRMIKYSVYARLGITLKEEIKYIGVFQ